MERLHRASSRAVYPCLALAFIIFSTPSQPATAQQAPRAAEQSASFERPDPDSVVLRVTVTDKKGNYVGGVDKSYFKIYDGKTPQEISFFSSQDEPLSVGIVFDASASMEGPGRSIRHIGEALSLFMQRSDPRNDYFLIGFNQSPQLLVDWTRGGGKILSTLSAIEPKHNTALYDACYLAIEKIMRGPRPKRVLLLITDGLDNMSRYTFQELRKLVQESDVLLYPVTILTSFDPGSSLAMEGQAVLDELATVSGGRVFFSENSTKLNELFQVLASELRHQYLLAFRPAESARDGKWHKLKVKVAPPPGLAPRNLKQLYVRTREGYYATKNPR